MIIYTIAADESIYTTAADESIHTIAADESIYTIAADESIYTMAADKKHLHKICSSPKTVFGILCKLSPKMSSSDYY